jgi:hypothetical protein
MKQDEIIEMATQVSERNYGRIIFFEFEVEELEALIKLAAAKERQACAKLVGEFAQNYSAYELATIIRARG